MENNPVHAPKLRYSGNGREHSPTRERVLREVERGVSTTAEIVVTTGLHENTVRGHLDRLHHDGHVIRTRTHPEGRGRPALRWDPAPTPPDPYAELAVTLADALGTPASDPTSAARNAGLRWGERIAVAAKAESNPADSAARTLEKVLQTMAQQGFAPKLSPTTADGDASVLLHQCPLLAAARGNESIVCTVHEGMIEGLTREWSPGARASLTPFAHAHACRVRFQGVQ